MKRKKRRKKFEMPNGFKDVEEMNKCIAQTKLEKLRYKVSGRYLSFIIAPAVFMLGLFCILVFQQKIFDEFAQAEVYSGATDADGRWAKIYYVDGIEYLYTLSSTDITYQSNPKYIDYKVSDPNVAMIGRTKSITILTSCEIAFVLIIIGYTVYEIIRKKRVQKIYNEEREKFIEMYGEDE